MESPNTIANIITGMASGFLIHGAPIPDEVLTGIVDNVLLPLLTAR